MHRYAYNRSHGGRDMLDREMLYEALHKEIPILTTQIRKLYAELDQKFHLEGAKVPMTFGMDRDCLGSYTQAGGGEREHFHFSLLFVGYSVEHPLSRDDRMDLYKHEYAHYMQAHMKIPEKYQWQTGKHGSAWKYCCSLVGAAPTPYYRIGESLLKHDYDKALKNPIHDKTVPIRDTYRREQAYKSAKHSEIKFQVNDVVTHPKFGEGTVEEIVQLSNSVRLHIRFADDEVKKIDQKWLLRSGHK